MAGEAARFDTQEIFKIVSIEEPQSCSRIPGLNTQRFDNNGDDLIWRKSGVDQSQNTKGRQS